MNLKQKMERFGNLEQEIEDLKEQYRSNEGSVLTPEDESRLDSMQAEKVRLAAEIRTAEKTAVDPKPEQFRSNEPKITVKPGAVTKADRDKGLKAFFCKGTDFWRDGMEVDAAKSGINLSKDYFSIELPDEQHRSSDGQSMLSDAAGKHLIPQSTGMIFEEGLKYYWPWRGVVDVIRTPDFGPYEYISTNNTARTSYYVPELGTPTGVDEAFAKTTLGHFCLYSSIMPVSNQVLQSSRIGLEAQVTGVLSEDVARGIAQEVTAGTGSNGPPATMLGFKGQIGVGHTTADPDEITYADLRKLFFSVDRAYRDRPGTCFMMTDATLESLYGIVDDTGRPLMSDQNLGIRDLGFDAKLFGRPVYINNFLDEIGDETSPIIFGDAKAIKVRIINDIKVRKSDQKYWTQDAMAYIASAWVDVKYCRPTNIHPLRTLKMKAD